MNNNTNKFWKHFAIKKFIFTRLIPYRSESHLDSSSQIEMSSAENRNTKTLL